MYKRIIVLIVAILAGINIAVLPAQAASPPSDCAFSAQHPATLYNALYWSDSDMTAFHTPMYRAGACGKVYLESLGVWNAPACSQARLVTYHEDRTRNYVGDWYNLTGIGDLVNIRGSGRISNGRQYRVYIYACGRFRHPNFPPGFRIYTHVP